MTIAKTLLLATFSSVSLLACVAGDDELADDGDWQAQGNEINDVTCERIYECFEGPDLTFLQSLSPAVGQSAAECQDNMREQNENATQPCQPGEDYDPDLAEECIIDLQEVQCADFMEWLPYGGPATCRKVCS
jgi:hypothetical protein